VVFFSTGVQMPPQALLLFEDATALWARMLFLSEDQIEG